MAETLTLTINPLFESFLPPLEPQEVEALEEDILKYGIEDPIRTWNGMIIDGHNRYALAHKHNLTFDVKSMDFDSEDDVLGWMIQRQDARRNWTPQMRALYIGKLHQLRLKTGDGATAGELADKFNISERQVKRNSKLAAAVETLKKNGDADIEKKLVTKEVTADAIVKQVKEAASPAPKKPKDPLHDDFTEAVKSAGTTVQLAITKLLTAVDDVETIFKTRKVDLPESAIAKLRALRPVLEDAETDVLTLKSFLKNPADGKYITGLEYEALKPAQEAAGA